MGKGDGNFNPYDPVTREQMSVMLFRFIEIMDISLVQDGTDVVNQDDISDFVDQGYISYWADAAVRTIQAAGIVHGRPDGRFDPQATATRAEVATMLARLLAVMEYSRS